MSKALDTIHRLREEALKAKDEIEQRITETKNRIQQLCRSGTLEFDEAWPAWLADFERYADEGKQQLHVNLEGFAKPNDAHPITGHTSTLRSHAGHPFENGSRLDTGAVHAHINRKGIIQEARAWFESKCAEADVPMQEERHAELERLAEEVRKLESERDDLQDELSKLFRMAPSDRTKRAVVEQENQRYMDMVNQAADPREAADQASSGGAEIFRQPK